MDGERMGDRSREFDLLRLSVDTTAEAVIARFEGEIDLVTAPTFQERLAEVADLKEHMIVDLRGVTYLGSKAIHALYRAYQRGFRETSRRLIVVATSPPLRRVLTLAGVGNVMPVVGTLDEAFALLKPSDPLSGAPPSNISSLIVVGTRSGCPRAPVSYDIEARLPAG